MHHDITVDGGMPGGNIFYLFYMGNDKAENIGRLCFFNSVKSWGGGEKWHYDMACRLHDRGFEVMAITNKKSELKDRLQAYGISQKSFGISNLSFLNPFKIIQLVSTFRKCRFSTVILNLPSDLKVAGLAARLSGIPRIIYRRGSAIPVRDTIFNRLVFKYLVDDIIANSQETANTILSLNPKLFDKNRIHIIYNGIDLKDFDSSEENDHNPDLQRLYRESLTDEGPDKGPNRLAEEESIAGQSQQTIVIGNVGRFVKQKGQALLLEVASHLKVRLKARGIGFKMLIAGKGKLDAQLKLAVEDKNLDDVVAFPGFTNDIKAFMKGIDIFVLPSLWEGFGYVLVEAMASKKPVVAFDLSSNPEIVDRDKTGFLIKPFDVEEMANKIEHLAIDQALRTSMGEAGRKRVEEQFTMDRACENLIEVLLKVELLSC